MLRYSLASGVLKGGTCPNDVLYVAVERPAHVTLTIFGIPGFGRDVLIPTGALLNELQQANLRSCVQLARDVGDTAINVVEVGGEFSLIRVRQGAGLSGDARNGGI